MSAAMSRMNFDVSSPEQAVRWSVRWRQMLGMKQDHAFDDAGDAFALAPRYVCGVVRDEITMVAGVRRRWRLIRHRWWADMDRQAAQFRAVADEIERQREADQIAALQLSLPLGDGAHDCSPSRTSRALAMEAGDGA